MTKFEQALAKLASLPQERNDSAKIEQALTKLADLPAEDQDVVAEMILEFEFEDDYELTPEQMAEIERRAVEPDGELLTTDQVRDRLKLPRG